MMSQILIFAHLNVYEKYPRNKNGALPAHAATIKAPAQPVNSTAQHPGGQLTDTRGDERFYAEHSLPVRLIHLSRPFLLPFFYRCSQF